MSDGRQSSTAAPNAAPRTWRAWVSRQGRVLMAATAVGGVMFWGCPTVALKALLTGGAEGAPRGRTAE